MWWGNVWPSIRCGCHGDMGSTSSRSRIKSETKQQMAAINVLKLTPKMHFQGFFVWYKMWSNTISCKHQTFKTETRLKKRVCNTRQNTVHVNYPLKTEGNKLRLSEQSYSRPGSMVLCVLSLLQFVNLLLSMSSKPSLVSSVLNISCILLVAMKTYNKIVHTVNANSSY